MKQIKLAGIVFILLAGIAGACFGSMAPVLPEPAGSFHNLVLTQPDFIVVVVRLTVFENKIVRVEGAVYLHSNLYGGLGLYYYNARWMDPETGRFISEDPMQDGGNWYAYGANNPLMFTDPSGMTVYYQPGDTINHGDGNYTKISDNPEDYGTAHDFTAQDVRNNVPIGTPPGSSVPWSNHSFYTTDWDKVANNSTSKAIADRAKACGMSVKNYLMMLAFKDAMDQGEVFKEVAYWREYFQKQEVTNKIMSDRAAIISTPGLGLIYMFAFGITEKDPATGMSITRFSREQNTFDFMFAFGSTVFFATDVGSAAGPASAGIAGNAGKIVIGEGMDRVKDVAKSKDAKWYQAWSKYFKPENFDLEKSLLRNQRWIESKIKNGFEIIDIGPENDVIKSPFYKLEKEIIKKYNYPTTSLKK